MYSYEEITEDNNNKNNTNIFFVQIRSTSILNIGLLLIQDIVLERDEIQKVGSLVVVATFL